MSNRHAFGYLDPNDVYAAGLGRKRPIYMKFRMSWKPWRWYVVERSWNESTHLGAIYEGKEKVLATNLTKLEADGWLKLMRSYDK